MFNNIINLLRIKYRDVNKPKIEYLFNKIKNNPKEAIPFTLEDEQLSCLDSFVGDGDGYIPRGFKPPINMKLILQINFSLI